MSSEPPKRPPLSEADKLVLHMLHDYPLEPGQMLLLGPLSVAYITGDHLKAPWLMPGHRPPGGKRLPDKYVIERSEWNGTLNT